MPQTPTETPLLTPSVSLPERSRPTTPQGESSSPGPAHLEQLIQTQIDAGQGPIQLEYADGEGLLRILRDYQAGIAEKRRITTAEEELADKKCLTHIGDYAGAMFNRLKGTGQLNGILGKRAKLTAPVVFDSLEGRKGSRIQQKAVNGLDKAAAAACIDLKVARYAIEVYAERNLVSHSKAGTANQGNNEVVLRQAISDDLATFPSFLSSRFLPHATDIEQMILNFRDTNTLMHPELVKPEQTSEEVGLPPVYHIDLLKHHRATGGARDAMFPPDPDVAALVSSGKQLSSIEDSKELRRMDDPSRPGSSPDRADRFVKKRRQAFSAADEPPAKRPRGGHRYPRAWDIDLDKHLQEKDADHAVGHLRAYAQARKQLQEVVNKASVSDAQAVGILFKDVEVMADGLIAKVEEGKVKKAKKEEREAAKLAKRQGAKTA